MVFFQWAVLPEHRQHRTIKSLYDGQIRLCLSLALLTEVRDVLTRPELATKFPSLTSERVNLVFQEARKLSEWFDNVPKRFSLPLHPKDDHLFDLAIESNASFLVTWETRLLKLQEQSSEHANQLKTLAPKLRIIEPHALPQFLKT